MHVCESPCHEKKTQAIEAVACYSEFLMFKVEALTSICYSC